MNFILGCVALALVVWIGGIVLQLAFMLVFAVIGGIGALLSSLFGKGGSDE